MHAVKNKADNKMSPLDGEFDAELCFIIQVWLSHTLCPDSRTSQTDALKTWHATRSSY